MSSKQPEQGTSKSSSGDRKMDNDKDNDMNLNMYPKDGKAKTVLEGLVIQRETGDFCDVQLTLSPGYTVNAHKAVLSACSPYFEGMFTSTFLEATSNAVDLSHIVSDTESLENVINSFYGVQFEIDEENVGEVMNLATMFLVDDLKDVCTRVMSKTISVQNAGEMMQLAFNFQIEDLKTRVTPVITARFHDYIMFQEDLVEMGNECFDYVLRIAPTENVARKAEYIQLVLNWFNASEGDERAEVAMRGLTTYRNFSITSLIYRDVESHIEDTIELLREVNSDVSEAVRDKFIHVLKKLKPNYYDKESNESDLEEDPPVEYRSYDMAKPYHRSDILQENPTIGPHTKQEGYTEEEEKVWLKQRQNIAEYDRLEKIWADYKQDRIDKGLKFSLTQICDRGVEIYNKRQKLSVKYPIASVEFKARNIRPKTRQELDAESHLLDCVVVLSPSSEFIKSDLSPNISTTAEESLEDTMFICVFVPKKRAWYKLGTVSSIGFKSQRDGSSGQDREDDWREPMADRLDSMDPDDMEEMMMMYGPDMMMMMEDDMPSRYRRHIMEDIMMHRMPPRSMQRMMRRGDRDDYDDDDDDDRGRQMHSRMMMMRMMKRMGRPMFGFEPSKLSKSSVKSLLKGEWKMTYFEHRLFFYFKGLYKTIWCYDIVNQDWKEFSLNTKSTRKEEDDHKKYERPDGLELAVIGQTLYAVIVLSFITTESNWRNRDDYGSKTVDIKYKIMKLSEYDKFEFYMETKMNSNYVGRDQFEEDTRPEEQKRYSSQPTPLKHGVFKIVIFPEDDALMDIFLMIRTSCNDIVAFKPGFLCMAYLDLKESETSSEIPYHHNFRREFTPLVFDDMLTLYDDDLKLHATINLAIPHTNRNRTKEYSGGDLEKSGAFKDAEVYYPKCPNVVTSNGRSMWILEGRERDISEMTEATSIVCQTYAQTYAKRTKSVPPPFRVFSMACAGQIDRNVLRRYNPPTKYLHT